MLADVVSIPFTIPSIVCHMHMNLAVGRTRTGFSGPRILPGRALLLRAQTLLICALFARNPQGAKS
jgi:hypothetical protein